jgi:hypothetical protein
MSRSISARTAFPARFVECWPDSPVSHVRTAHTYRAHSRTLTEPSDRVSPSGGQEHTECGDPRGTAGLVALPNGLGGIEWVLDAPGRAHAGGADGRRLLAAPRRGATGEDCTSDVAARVRRHRRGRGKRRIHQSPSRTQVVACQPWFAAELRAVTPAMLILLGAVAAKSVFGQNFRVTSERGRQMEGPGGTPTVTTLHPSSILRGAPESRKARKNDLVRDLTLARRSLETRSN